MMLGMERLINAVQIPITISTPNNPCHLLESEPGSAGRRNQETEKARNQETNRHTKSELLQSSRSFGHTFA